MIQLAACIQRDLSFRRAPRAFVKISEDMKSPHTMNNKRCKIHSKTKKVLIAFSTDWASGFEY